MKPVLFTLALTLYFTCTMAQQPGTVKPDSVYEAVDQQPSYPGGMDSLYKYLVKHIKYPSAAVTEYSGGKVFVTFVVEKNGSLSNVKILKGVSRDIDTEAVRVVRTLPKWNPAILNNEPVRAQFTVMVNFRLADPSKFDSLPVYSMVDKEAVPSDGWDGFYFYLQMHINYPKSARKAHVQGTVLVNFLVEPDGSVSHVHVMNRLTDDIDAEAVRLIKDGPKWDPALLKDGTPVRTSYVLPVSFIWH